MATAEAGRRRPQRGALMVALMAGIAIMMILSAVAVQSWSDVIRRDNEAEMIFRAEDLVRALKRYQKDQGKLPNELKELAEPGQKGQYFLRRLWKDPLVKGGKWQLLYAAPGGGLFDPTVTPTEGTQPSGLGSPGGGLGGAQAGGLGAANGAAAADSGPGGIPDIIQHDDGSSEVSGLPIAGVKTRCTEKPFRLYRDKAEYKEWAFSVFDATNNAGAVPTPGPGNPPAGGTGQPAPGGSLKQPTFPPR